MYVLRYQLFPGYLKVEQRLSFTIYFFNLCAALHSHNCCRTKFHVQHATCLLQDDSADSFDAVACSCLQISLFVCLFVCVCVFVALLVAACSYCCCCCSFSGCCCCCFRLCTVALIIVSQTVACMCNLRLFTYSLIYIYICFRLLINLCALHSPKGVIEKERQRQTASQHFNYIFLPCKKRELTMQKAKLKKSTL